MTRLVSALLLAIAAATFASAQAQAQDGLSGTWRHAGSGSEAAQREAAIEASTEDLNFMIRSRARGALAERTTPAHEFRIAVVGDLVQLTRDSRTLSVTVGGPAQSVSGDQGEGRIRATRREGDLVLTMQGESGTLTTVYRLSEDGQRLTLSVQMSGERLSTPIRYRVTYRRA